MEYATVGIVLGKQCSNMGEQVPAVAWRKRYSSGRTERA